jgi:hypothetical protein
MSISDMHADLERIASGEMPGSTERDRAFAEDLLRGRYGIAQRGYLTENQGRAALRMIDRLTKEPSPVDRAPEMAKLYEFMLNAKKSLKYPKLMLAMGTRHLKVYVSGARSRTPDTVNLVTEDQYGSLDLWLGRVLPSGEWQHRDIEPELHQQAAQLLARLAENPAAVAAESGHVSGNCCFCNRPLTDEGEGRSVAVGYGPVCASRWGLPWG